MESLILTLMPPETSITPRELYERLSKGPVEMLDVRTPGEYATEHVAGVRLIPISELNPAEYLKGRQGDGGPIYVF